MADRIIERESNGSGMNAVVAVVALIVIAAIAWFAYQYFAGGNTPTTNVNVSTPSVTGQ